MAKVNHINESAKYFLPGHVEIHMKARNTFRIMQKCIFKVDEYKKQIENIDADIKLVSEYSHSEISGFRQDLILLYNYQVQVYRRILAYYLTLLAQLYTEDLYHNMFPYPKQQPDARTNVAAA